MSRTNYALTCLVVLTLSGCAAIAGKTNNLTDGKIKSDVAGTLGYQPDQLALESRRTEGTNTYVNVKTNDGKEFACVINGGNWLTFGMTNPPTCNKKGDPGNAHPVLH